jgi:hypothetical protein
MPGYAPPNQSGSVWPSGSHAIVKLVIRCIVNASLHNIEGWRADSVCTAVILQIRCYNGPVTRCLPSMASRGVMNMLVAIVR